MSYLNRPYESNYYEAETEVIREGPYGSYSAEYRVDEYGNRVPHHNHHRHNGVGEVVSEIVTDVISGGRHHGNHNHYNGPTEIIERREERIVDSSYDPYRRSY
ncbi:hypothetical protein SOVF_066710 [Spinacia oleracea]|uniref:Uncharacterized protein n=1 Tax=Spinacia oleracea TaxID=3562 RepID=A0A9R0ICD0_SPIOL|nr:uncharacterized protein LOC110786433 [Spinacia oleracea]KNA18870.1 hypothetical protein SOVF_066710 [Spinacia oleracea]